MKKNIIWFVSIILVGTGLYFFVLTRTLLIVDSNSGHFNIYRDGQQIITNHSGLVYLAKGDYAVASTIDGQPTAIAMVSTTIWPVQKISVAGDKPTTKYPHLIMSQNAQLVTPLDGGYIYKNGATNGIEYADQNGIQNVSQLFDIKSKLLLDSSENYNSIVNIQADGQFVYITTTRNIYRLSNLNDIESSNFNNTLIARSELNTKNKTIDFLVNSVNGTYSAFSLPTDNLSAPIQQIYNSKLLIGSIATGGDLVAVYDDNIPSTNASVLSAFAAKKQVTPVFINQSTGQINDNIKLPADIVYTNLVISPDAKYVAYRTKWSSQLIVLDASSGQVVAILPATTLSTYQWSNDGLYYNYGNLLIKFDPESSVSSVIASTNVSIINFTFGNESIILTTNDGYSYKLSEAKSSIDLSKIKLSSQNDNYTIGFSSIDGGLHIYQFCAKFEPCVKGSDFNTTVGELQKTAKSTKVDTVDNDWFSADYRYLNN